MTQPQSTQPQTISYASPRSPEPDHHRSIAGGAVLLFVALGLIFLGGCFLIGIVRVHSNIIVFGPYMNWPLALQVMPWLLYALALAGFSGAARMLRAGVRWIYATG